MSASIVIADDHPLMLRGLSDFIKSKGHTIVASAEDGKSAYNLIVKHKPEIAILDISMPMLSGLEVAKLCNTNNLKTKIILITFDNGEDLYDKALEYNVYGYILKDFAIEKLENCIKSVSIGEPYFTEEMTSYLKGKKESSDFKEKISCLTKTECKVLHLIANHNTSLEVSELLNSAVRTIEKHRSNIVKKMQLEHTPNALTNWAMEHKSAILKWCNSKPF